MYFKFLFSIFEKTTRNQMVIFPDGHNFLVTRLVHNFSGH